MASSSSNVVGVHYRVGKKIGEGSFGVIFEGTNLLNNQQVAIKFVSKHLLLHARCLQLGGLIFQFSNSSLPYGTGSVTSNFLPF
jgi:serine/threonine protein kinase